MAATYQGWSNYPTWAVNLWLESAEADATTRVVQAADNDVAAALKRWVTDNQVAASYDKSSLVAADYDKTMMLSDLVGYALSEVDWEEIAAAWIHLRNSP